MKDRVALIAGADDDIGEAIALRFAADGARLALSGAASPRLTRLAADIAGRDGEAIAVSGDLTDPQAAQSVVGRCMAHYGQIHILVNNAPEPKGQSLGSLSLDAFGATIGTSLGSPFYFMREVAPAMREGGYGRIVTLTGLAYLGRPNMADTAAAQAGVFGLTRSVALELARSGITVNTVVKGDIAVPTMSDEDKEKLANGIPVKRLGTPADIANAVAFFAASTARYVTGQTFFVCGGKSAYFSMSV